MAMARLLKTIRKAVRESGQTRYAIAKGTGLSAAQLSRLENDKGGLSVGAVEAIADHLGLEIIVRKRAKKGD